MNSSNRQGAIFAVLAYTMWGIAPIYFKLLQQIPAMEMVAHRVVWSFVLLAGLLTLRVGWQAISSLLREPQKLAWLTLSSALIGLNWLIFIWAVNNNRMLDASLGYYINPIVNVALGMVFLQERLARLQWVAIALATVGVTIQIVNFGSVPWIALALAVSFAFYGLLRKRVRIDGVSGLWVETALILPVALWYLFAISPDNIIMSEHSLTIQVSLIAAGLITTAPLLCFIAAAKRLPLSQLGFFQYIGPSLMFILATLFYDEAVTSDKLITFGFIWAALAVFSWHGLRSSRQPQQ
ncbi:EamA family transporter RarD [Neiella marina]|uniref:EamA family transporter RarD n=1 Tax=Neiella holothuriorum TaxID=2870530 RepID=A0ABS7ECA7_9GAMM|nr:EamA family transporter RarD [Neiella holothuriorum]MBW8189963.1 EamA family transporter RarD [Neiella holothuriorum]